MAKSLKSVRPGVLAQCGGTIEANIFNLLLEQRLKANDEPVTITEIAETLRERKDTVYDKLAHLEGVGLLNLPSDAREWTDVNAIYVKHIGLSLERRNGNPQKEMDLDHQKVPAVPKSRVTRRKDQVEQSGTVYKATVTDEKQGDGTCYYRLVITAQDLSGQEPGEIKVKVEDPMPFGSVAEAFAWWDQWREGLAETNYTASIEVNAQTQIRSLIERGFLARATEGEHEGYIVIDLAPKSYDALLATFNEGQPIENPPPYFQTTDDKWHVNRVVGGLELEGFEEQAPEAPKAEKPKKSRKKKAEAAEEPAPATVELTVEDGGAQPSLLDEIKELAAQGQLEEISGVKWMFLAEFSYQAVLDEFAKEPKGWTYTEETGVLSLGEISVCGADPEIGGKELPSILAEQAARNPAEVATEEEGADEGVTEPEDEDEDPEAAFADGAMSGEPF